MNQDLPRTPVLSLVEYFPTNLPFSAAEAPGSGVLANTIGA